MMLNAFFFIHQTKFIFLNVLTLTQTLGFLSVFSVPSRQAQTPIQVYQTSCFSHTRDSLRRSSSTSALASDKGPLPEDQPLRRPVLSSPARVNFLTGTAPSGTRPVQQSVTQSSYEHKELVWEAECQKKFRALPVPSHVTLPLYRQMTELRETRRKQCLDQRKDFLLSSQKPFSFQEREREKLMAMLSQVAQDQTSKLQKLTASTATAGTATSVKEAEQADVSPPGKSEQM